MVFSSLTFLCVFLPVVIGLHTLIKNIRIRNVILLIASLLFYAWGEPVWIVAMLFATAVNYVCARIIDGAKTPGGRKLALIIGSAPTPWYVTVHWYVMFFYVLNTLMVAAGIGIYFRNRALEKKSA